MRRGYQFFTTDMLYQAPYERWFPMDHFFFAPYDWNPEKGGLQEKGKIVHLETHANVSSPSGFGVSVIQGSGKKRKREEFGDIPSALRRMADIIEAFEKKRA